MTELTAERQADPMAVQVGGGYYKKLAIQPAEFWIRNQLPSTEGAIVKYLTRHASKIGRQDIEKAIHFTKMLIWWYFDAPDDQRATPMHWRGQRNFVINPGDYCRANQLGAQESAAIMLVCDFSCREHLSIALQSMREILARDYPSVIGGPSTTRLDRFDLLYLAKERLEEYLSVLEAAPSHPEQRGRLKALIDRLNREWRSR